MSAKFPRIGEVGHLWPTVYEVILRRFYKIAVSENAALLKNCSEIAFKEKSKELFIFSDLVHHAGHK